MTTTNLNLPYLHPVTRVSILEHFLRGLEPGTVVSVACGCEITSPGLVRLCAYHDGLEVGCTARDT